MFFWRNGAAEAQDSIAIILHQSTPLHYLQILAFVVASQLGHISTFSSTNACNGVLIIAACALNYQPGRKQKTPPHLMKTPAATPAPAQPPIALHSDTSSTTAEQTAVPPPVTSPLITVKSPKLPRRTQRDDPGVRTNIYGEQVPRWKER
jgi:hypothetical protein